jgi:HemY protein
MILSDAGYVLIKVHQIAVETSLLVFAIIIVMAVIVVLGLLKILARILGVKTQWRQWQDNRNRQKAQNKINQGVLSLLQEDWASAKTALHSATKHEEYALVSLLALADTGQRMGDLKMRDESFDRLDKTLGREGQLALGLARADHYQAAKQWQEAQNVLEPLRTRHPKHPGTLQRLLNNYLEQKAWASLEDALKQAQKLKILEPDTFKQFESQCYTGNFTDQIHAAHHRATLAQANPKPDNTQAQDIEHSLSQALIKQWQQAKNDYKCNTQYTLDIIEMLSSSNFEEAAKDFSEQAIKHKSAPELIQRYGQLNCKEPSRLIAFLESELDKTPHTAEYLFALGRLYAQSGDFAKAHPLLVKSLQHKQSATAYRCLADVYDKLQQHERSSKCYQKALAIG